jgi:hypothetical protein
MFKPKMLIRGIFMKQTWVKFPFWHSEKCLNREILFLLAFFGTAIRNGINLLFASMRINRSAFRQGASTMFESKRFRKKAGPCSYRNKLRNKNSAFRMFVIV